MGRPKPKRTWRRQTPLREGDLVHAMTDGGRDRGDTGRIIATDDPTVVEVLWFDKEHSVNTVDAWTGQTDTDTLRVALSYRPSPRTARALADQARWRFNAWIAAEDQRLEVTP